MVKGWFCLKEIAFCQTWRVAKKQPSVYVCVCVCVELVDLKIVVTTKKKFLLVTSYYQ